MTPPAPRPPRAETACWPVKPLDRQHPVRGSFGDPCVIFKVPPTQKNLRVGDGSFSFHAAGKAVLKEQIGVDFRSTIPPNKQFWSYYARGTYQNMWVFGTHYSYRQPGCFLVKLTRKPLDTKTILDGVYDLIVTATDIRGNTGSRSRRITVRNRPGWVGS